MQNQTVPSNPVVIVGAGLAGLSCALELAAAGVRSLVLEASEAVGGRVRTDEVEGFLLDRGFQVLLTAYPEARRLLDYPALDLRPFYPGAVDPQREPLPAARGSVAAAVGRHRRRAVQCVVAGRRAAHRAAALARASWIAR